MKRTSESRSIVGVGILVVLAAAATVSLSACQPAGDTVPIDIDDIGGVVSGPNGPEAGVLGHRGNDRPAHEAQQDCRDGR